MSKHIRQEVRVAIDENNPAIVRDEDLCVECRLCAGICNEYVGVNNAYDLAKTGGRSVCIHCGQCIPVCPTNSLQIKSSCDAVRKAVADPDKIVIFSTSPSVRVALGDAFGMADGAFVEGQMVELLRRLGGDYVLDTNFAADLTICEEAAELIERITKAKGPLPQFTSCCPAWVRYCETFHPEMIPHISSAKSPIGMQGPTVKTYFAKKMNLDPKRIVHVAVTPCTAKKAEILREEMNAAGRLLGDPAMRDTDYVITTVELADWAKAARINFAELPEGAFDRLMGEGSGAGVIFGNTGGVMEAALRTAYRHLTGDSFNGACAQHMAFVSGTGTVGLANGGLNGWGIAVRAGQTFAGRLWLKGRGEVVVALQSADGKREYASRRLTGLGAEWRCFPFELTASATDDRARFALLLDRPGSIEVDQASLMSTGADRFRGLPVRGDIGEAMVDEGLTFLRYGGTMVNAEGYRFKKMIGDRDRRPPYRGHWYRYSTNGFGIEEFVQFCEKAGFEAAFAVNIEETPEDMADMVEYLNGPADSEWGRRRAANGHPEPYGVRYIGIGNEEVFFNGDRGDEYDHYVERFLLLHDAIKAVDPSVQLVATAWWRPDSPHMERTFRALDGKADFWDYHPWANQLSSGRKTGRELQRMYELFHEWNPATKMRCAIFEENGDSHDMLRVLGHVTIQNAVRRMGDFVLTSCAANALQPYGQNDNGWDQGQLFFTPSRVWGMPPYHAQRMASTYHQPLLVGCRTTGAEKVLDVTATRSRDAGRLVLHMVNTGAEPLRVNLQVEGFGTVASARRISLAGGLNAVNTPEEPQRVVPQEDALAASADQSCELEPYSYTIVVLDE